MKKTTSEKTVLITGAGGLLGQALVKSLAFKNYTVRAVVHKVNLYFPPLANIEMIEGNIINIESVKKFCKNIDVCIHLAARKLDESDSYQVNVEGTQNLLKYCTNRKVKLFIYISTLAVNIQNKGIYAQTKYIAGELVKKSKLPFLILRPGIIYGDPYKGVFASLVRYSSLSITPMIGNGSQQVSPIYVDDVAEIIAECLFSKKIAGKIFDVGGKESITLKQFLLSIRKYYHEIKNAAFVLHIPINIGFFLARIFALFLSKPPITVSNIKGSTQILECEPEKLLKLLKYQPRSLKEGLQQTKEEFGDKYKLAKSLLKYVGLNLSSVYDPTKDDVQTLVKFFPRILFKDQAVNLVTHFPHSLAFADIMTKIFWKNSGLPEYLYYASALVETHPVSASSFLPQRRTKVQIAIYLSSFLFKSAVLFGLGFATYVVFLIFVRNE